MRWPHCARGCSMVAERGTGSSGRCYRCLPVDVELMRANPCDDMQPGSGLRVNARQGTHVVSPHSDSRCLRYTLDYSTRLAASTWFR